MQTTAAARQRQIRGFLTAWLAITLLMGALTFIGIYYATGLINNDADSSKTIVSAPDEANNTGGSNPFNPAAIASTQVPTAAGAVEATATQAVEVAAVVPAADQNAAQQNASAPDGQGGGPILDPAILALTATAIPTPTPLPSAATPTLSPAEDKRFQVGIQVEQNADPEVYKIWMGEVRDKLKLNWIKQQVRWADVEAAQGQYDWGALDVTFDLASQYDINVMVSVVTAPDWAREPGNQRLDEVGPPSDPSLYATFLTALLTRYPGQIHAVEVWNEMNIDREWASVYGLSAQRYVDLLRAAYAAIKAVDPGIIVISGALSPTGWNDGVAAYDDFVYMDMLIQAGLLDTVDCVGAHHNGYNIGPNVPYNNVPNDPTATFRGPFDNPHHSWSFYSTLNGYAQKIQQAGSDKKLCITEFGWPTTEDLNGYPAGFEFANDNTLAEQAQFLGEAIDVMDQWGFVWLAFIWNLNYGPQAGWDAANDNVPYSLLRPNWAPAPAYEVIGAHDFRGTVQ